MIESGSIHSDAFSAFKSGTKDTQRLNDQGMSERNSIVGFTDSNIKMVTAESNRKKNLRTPN